MDALSGIASDVFDKQPRKKLSRKERKAQAKEMKKLQKESNAKLKANAKSNKSIQKQLKDRDKELSKKNEFARYRRKTAKDVTSFIGYNRMKTAYARSRRECSPPASVSRTLLTILFARMLRKLYLRRSAVSTTSLARTRLFNSISSTHRCSRNRLGIASSSIRAAN